MSDVIISVEGLGKKYVLSHQGGERGGYKRFSEKLEDWIKKPFAALAGGGRREVEGNLPPTSFHLPQASREEFWALKDVSFEVKRGEVVGIIGRNGAGKSTLLKILSRITEPTEGRVTLRGRVASLLEVGTGFHPELTGRENIFLNGAILGMSKAEIRKKFDEIVAFAEVERFLDTPVKRYSSGMYVRLAFAVAAHLEPEILVVDEVLAVGDFEFQKKCLGKMQDVAGTGRTVLFVSHNMEAIQRLCSKCIYLNNGKIQSKGDVVTTINLMIGSNARQNKIVDLRTTQRSIQTRGKAKILSLTMANNLQLSPWSLYYGESLKFKLNFESKSNFNNFEIGISIFSISGVEIISSLSSHASNITSLEKGIYEVDYTIENCYLLPGQFYVQIGLRSESGMEDFIGKASEIQIAPSNVSSKNKADTLRGFISPEIKVHFSHKK